MADSSNLGDPFRMSAQFGDIVDSEDNVPDDVQHTETHMTNENIENHFEDLSQVLDNGHDTEAKIPDDVQNTETLMPNDKVEQAGEEENIFESHQQFGCTITVVEGQFDDQ